MALPEPPDFPLTPFPPADLEPALLPTAHELVSVDAPPNHKKFLGVWGIPMKVIDISWTVSGAYYTLPVFDVGLFCPEVTALMLGRS